MDEKDRIIEGLRAELEKAKAHEKEYKESRKAMLLMLEDLNESTAGILRSKREWEGTFDAISDPLFLHDRDLRVVRANKAYAEAAGVPFKDFIGKPYYEVFPKMEKPFAICLKALERLEEATEEFFYPHTNRTFNVRFYPIKGGDGEYLYSIHILEDITEAKRAEQKIKTEMEITSHLLMIAEATAHTTDIDKLMEQVVHCGHEIMKCDVCLSYLWDEEAKRFEPCQSYGLAHEMIPFFKTGFLDEKTEFIKKAIDREDAVVIRFGAMNPGLFSWLPDIKTIAAVPLVGKMGSLGVIIGIFKSTKEFEERDAKLMRGISHQVSTALEQARLYKEAVNKSMVLSRKIETIQVMNEIDRSILSTLEAKDILETVTRLVSKIISCDRATVALVDKERRGFIYTAGFGTTVVSKGAFVPFEDTSAADVVKMKRPEYVANIADIKNLLPLEDKFYKDGFLSHIRVPLTVKGEIIAVLSIGSKRPSAFTPDDLSTSEKIAAQIGVALSNARLISDLEDLFLGIVKSLSSAIDAKSPWTAGHSERVTKYALQIGKEMRLSEQELKNLELAGLLHDVGKIGTYEAVLDKPGKLTDEELKIMRQHPAKGAEILSPIKQLKNIIPAIRYHQEYYDGTGYPEGIKGEAIPLFARIIGVADTVDAMGADRPYRKGRPMDAIVAELKRCSGSQFDPKVVETFLRILQL